MPNRSLLITASVALMMGTPFLSARGAQVVWSGLVIAENVEQPSAIPPELSKIEQTLKELFGYNQFQIIGESRKTLKTGEEDWLAASKYFSLAVDAQGESDSGYAVNLKLYKEKDLMLETNTKLSKQSPLVVKGPLVGNGQLLLVLVTDDEHPTEHHAHHRQSGPTSTVRRFVHRIRNLFP